MNAAPTYTPVKSDRGVVIHALIGNKSACGRSSFAWRIAIDHPVDCKGCLAKIGEMVSG